MTARTVGVGECAGRVLCTSIFRAGGKKLLAKGHLISEEDMRMLETEGMVEVWVTELEEDEIAEDDAVMQVASEIGCGALEIRLAAGGRANLFATQDACVLVDDELLKQINCAASMVVGTRRNFCYVTQGERVATVKSIPFAVTKAQLEAVVTMVQERGPLLQVRPFHAPRVAVLYTDPLQGDRSRLLFDNVMRQRLDRFGVAVSQALTALEDEEPVARSIQQLLRAQPTAVVIASPTAPAGPEDVIGRAMVRAGCQIERFLAPVEPGNLLIVGYYGDIPVITAPGCYRSTKPNVLDLILPPMLARYHVTSWEIVGLGHGGLLA